jgi:hypothetical protein
VFRAQALGARQTGASGAMLARAIAASPPSTTVSAAQPMDPIEETLERRWSDARGRTPPNLTSNFLISEATP